jgi:hypothetical protein
MVLKVEMEDWDDIQAKIIGFHLAFGSQIKDDTKKAFLAF